MEHAFSSTSTLFHNIPEFVEYTHVSNSPLSAEQLAVFSTFSTFIAGLNSTSPSTMKSVILPVGSFVQHRLPDPQNPTGTTHWTLDAAVDQAIHKIQKAKDAGRKFEETIGEDGMEVKIDGSLAMMWAKYYILEDGEKVMEGRNVVTMIHVDGRGWVISGIADTGRVVAGK